MLHRFLFALLLYFFYLLFNIQFSVSSYSYNPPAFQSSLRSSTYSSQYPDVECLVFFLWRQEGQCM